jgi:BirA family biotin operon repressor/biotin-[acetyl-CoA-carboxylase] ligase
MAGKIAAPDSSFKLRAFWWSLHRLSGISFPSDHPETNLGAGRRSVRICKRFTPMLPHGDTLQLTRIISETFLADGEYHDAIDSTNNRAKVLAASVEIALPYLVLAEEQTAGRGRGLRQWWTGKGSLAFSIIIPLSQDRPTSTAPSSGGPTPATSAWSAIPEDSIRLLGLAGAVAVYRAARDYVPSNVPLGIHWPNDVYANDAKLAGVLVEVTANRRAVIGIGVNVNNQAEDAPPDLLSRIATLSQISGQMLDRTALLIEILNHLQDLLGILTTQPRQLTEEANHMCLQKGRELVLKLEHQLVNGKCLGIDPTGALILQTDAGERRFLSGTVVAVE